MKKIGKNTKLYLIGMIIGGITLGITTVIADTIINSTSVAYKTTTVKAALDELYDIADFKEEVKDMLYPVGSIYISVSSTNPSQLFGGTWVSFGMGRTLVGVGAVEGNTYLGLGNVTPSEFGHGTAETRGGEYTHTLSVSELPSHNHSINFTTTSTEESGYGLPKSGNFANRVIIQTNGYAKLESNWSGGGGGHNIMQPYITVYMWKRTA